MKISFPILLSIIILLLQLRRVQSRAKYIWPSQAKEEKDALKNVTTAVKKSAKVKVKSSKSKLDSQSNAPSEAKGIINTKNSKGEEPEGIARQKIINDVRSEKVKDVTCRDKSSKIRKEGEEWHEKEECNSCSCICRPNGKQNCFCTRMGC